MKSGGLTDPKHPGAISSTAQEKEERIVNIKICAPQIGVAHQAIFFQGTEIPGEAIWKGMAKILTRWTDV